MDFWAQHSILFVIGLILWPRIILLYFGHIPSLSLPPIFGFIFVPRLLLVGFLTPQYWGTNPFLIAICWILAVVIDVFALISKTGMSIKMAQEHFKTVQGRLS